MWSDPLTSNEVLVGTQLLHPTVTTESPLGEPHTQPIRRECRRICCMRNWSSAREENVSPILVSKILAKDAKSLYKNVGRWRDIIGERFRCKLELDKG